MVKERISLTLEGELVKKVDREIEKRGISNRSKGVEQFLTDYLRGRRLSTAVVLAGGESKNYLINVDGRSVINHSLDHLEEAGIDKVFIATDNPELEAEVKDSHSFDLEFVMEDEPLGTGGALREIGEMEESFAVVNGDVICDVDFEDMADVHEDASGIVTVALTTVRDASDYGVIRMKGNKIVGFTEKPEDSYSHLINAGIYILDPEFLDLLPSKDEQTRVELENVFEGLADEGRLNGYVYEGEWHEVG